MADIDLPVYSFRANWADGVIERLIWLTSLLKGEEGAEQRFSRRLTPRREAEVDLLLHGPERTFYDLWIHRLAGGEFMAPLYWDSCPVSNKLTAASTTRVDFDTRFTEFVPGSLAMLQGNSALTFEVVEIDAVDDGGVDLSSAVLSTWDRGKTRILPLRRAMLSDMGSMAHYSAKVAGISAKVGYVAANPFADVIDSETMYGSYPLFLQEPNWADDLSVDLARDLVVLDNDTGLPYLTDPTGRSNVGQAQSWLFKDREEQTAFKTFLYARRGRAEAFWMPTFKGDLELAQTALAASTQAIVNACGLVYTGVPTSGRDHLIIFPRGTDPLPRRITSTVAGSTAATEKVNLDLPMGLDLSPGLARKISFLDTAHFDQDEFEINHISATVAETSAIVRTFKDSRDPSGTIYYPIPTAEMSDDPCGTPGPCYVHDNFIRYRVEFLGPWDGNGRIGEPGLGWWLYAQHINGGLHGPNEEFICKDYGQWAEPLGAEHYPFDPLYSSTAAQWLEHRIQGGSGTSGCPSEGDRREALRVLVHKPGWSHWKALLADLPGHGTSNFIDGMAGIPNAVTGIGGFQSSGFPGTMYLWMPSDDDIDAVGYGAGAGGTPGYAAYTAPYLGT